MQGGSAGTVLAEDIAHPYFATAIGDLAHVTGSLHAIAIDMPLRLPNASRRQADVLARDLAGPLPRIIQRDASSGRSSARNLWLGGTPLDDRFPH